MNKLTAREQEVLALYLKSGRLETVAKDLGISMHTARRHKEHVMQKLCVRNAVELAFSAIRRGLVSAPKGTDE